VEGCVEGGVEVEVEEKLLMSLTTFITAKSKSWRVCFLTPIEAPFFTTSSSESKRDSTEA